jgi:hypothetical protein
MQYSFSFYYYAMNRHKAQPPNVTAFLEQHVDSNHDGYIDSNEMRTLASIVYGRSPTDDEILNLVANCSNYNSALTVSAQPHLEYDFGTVYKAYHFSNLNPTVAVVANCSWISTSITTSVDWAYSNAFSLGQDKEIAFEMIGDNTTDTLKQLDSIRRRKVKFICINDNMQQPSAELLQHLQDFFEALFPLPSPFELPSGQVNPTLYTDEYMTLIRRHRPADGTILERVRRKFSDSHRSLRSLLREIVQILSGQVMTLLGESDDRSELEVVVANAANDVLYRMPKSSINKHVESIQLWGLLLTMIGLVGLYFIWKAIMNRSKRRSTRE